ncbi:MAG: 30S ribosomal protein S7 [Desulforegulaceae bacterium]|nr:30S ribosomal protein S7 [Desulforegulaceae bacterium]
MPRRREIPKRKIKPDSKYGNELISRFINKIMYDGKKSVAEKVVYSALDLVGEKSGEPAVEVFKKAMDNVRPMVEVKARRVGGSTYQVPSEIRSVRQTALAINWLIKYSRSRSEKSMPKKLAAEFLDAANNRGASVKKKEDTHKMAEANKAFAHYRW